MMLFIMMRYCDQFGTSIYYILLDNDHLLFVKSRYLIQLLLFSYVETYILKSTHVWHAKEPSMIKGYKRQAKTDTLQLFTGNVDVPL